jgi:Uri superfamily endonuclease
MVRLHWHLSSALLTEVTESVCPICFTQLLAVLAEEEMAVAMDSPAHPVDELGVTRLKDTCGHLFCRKELS